MLWIVEFATLESTGFCFFFADSTVFYSYSQYLMSSNFKAYQAYHFMKDLLDALKYFAQTVTIFLLSSAENIKIKSFF